MLQKIYDWMMAKAGHERAIWWLAGFAFVESSFFPIPPDILLIPMILAAPTQWLRLALICTFSSVLGGYFGYAIGYYAMETIGMSILGIFNLENSFEAMRPQIDRYGVWIIILKGATPIPYKLITITAGAFDFDLLKFTIASVISRGLRFLLIAALLRSFGTPIRRFIEKRLFLVTTCAAILLIGGFFLVRPLIVKAESTHNQEEYPQEEQNQSSRRNPRKMLSIDGEDMPIDTFNLYTSLTVEGDLDLRDTDITSLPMQLSVGGDCHLEDTLVTTLPDDMSVGGSLHLRGSAITVLPTKLSVGKTLDINDTDIATLPDDMSVGESLLLGYHTISFQDSGQIRIGTKIHTAEEWIGMSETQLLEAENDEAFWEKWKTPLLNYLKSRIR